MIDLKKIVEASTVYQVLTQVMNALHDVGGAYVARKALFGSHTEKPQFLTEPLKKAMQERALTDEQIEKYTLDVWTEAAQKLAEFHGGRAPCHACAVEAQFGSETNPHPLPRRFHTCRPKDGMDIKQPSWEVAYADAEKELVFAENSIDDTAGWSGSSGNWPLQEAATTVHFALDLFRAKCTACAVQRHYAGLVLQDEHHQCKNWGQKK